MAPSRALLDRNIRAPALLNTSEDYQSDQDGSMTADGDDVSGDSEDENADADERRKSEGDAAEVELGNTSFGALKQAQDALARKRKRGSDETDEQSEKLEVLRARLRELREKKGIAETKSSGARHAARVESDNAAGSDSDSGSAPSEEDAPGARSKHAPMAQSSKHQVTRKRQVIEVPHRKLRDPRFDALHSAAAHPSDNAEKAYSFLRDYQIAEVAELKAALKATKDHDEKEKLKTTIGAMENRLRAKAAKEREREVIRQHRKEEKEKVGQGKTPYYLKSAELKERVQVKRFEGMKGKEREKVVEKKRKKQDQKEKRRMPRARRMDG